VRQLEAIAPYPAADKLKIQDVLIERRWVNEFGGMSHGRTGLEYELGARALSPEWTSADLAADDNGEILRRLLPELARHDWTNVTTFKCPIVIFAGRYDYAVPSAVVERWFQNVRPGQEIHLVRGDGAHDPDGAAGLFASHLIADVLPLQALAR
jgi:pimeloyl-ACP methyl ester carboxylesterase